MHRYPARADVVQVLGGMNAALGYMYRSGGSFRPDRAILEPHFEGLEVAVVHAIGVASKIPRTRSSSAAGMDLAKNIKTQPMGFFVKSTQFGISQRRDYQQDRVRTVRPSFEDLEFVDDEVFAQAGNLRCCRWRLRDSRRLP